jgi:hypothetical protein
LKTTETNLSRNQTFVYLIILIIIIIIILIKKIILIIIITIIKKKKKKNNNNNNNNKNNTGVSKGAETANPSRVHAGFQWYSVCTIVSILCYALWIIVCPLLGWSMYCPCTTYGFRLVIVLSLYNLRLSFGHFIVSVLHTLSFGHFIVSVLLTAFVWSLYCLCTTYGFGLVIVLSMYYLRLSFGHCIVSVLLRVFDYTFDIFNLF